MKESPTNKESRRAPIVTVMGHVDHGKTSILDRIRKTEVQKGEAGGITQSIGAYETSYDGSPITFVDTPGHHAFAQMRARGGQVADIVLLVVAANDGVMPQTKEALSHAQNAGASIIVVVNKIDLDAANPNKVKKQLADLGLDLEEYGGNVPVVEASALSGEGVDEILKAITKVAAELDLTYNPKDKAKCVVVESFLDGKKGVVVHAIVIAGVLKVRDVLSGDATSARVKSLRNWKGESYDEAVCSTPIEILGFNDVPEVGSMFKVVDSLKKAQKTIDANNRAQTHEVISAQDRINMALSRDETTQLPLVVKTESNGTLEVVLAEIEKIKADEVSFKVIHSGVGDISENDVLLAVPVHAIVIGFNVDVDRRAEEIARREKIISRLYKIIYEMVEELTDVINGEVEALTIQILGTARIKQIFTLSDKSLVYGSEVLSGRIRKSNRAEVVRNDEVIAETRITSLRTKH